MSIDAKIDVHLYKPELRQAQEKS